MRYVSSLAVLLIAGSISAVHGQDTPTPAEPPAADQAPATDTPGETPADGSAADEAVGTAQAMDRPIAAATLTGKDGEQVGSVNLRDTPHGVVMRITLEGLPAGEHGIHIHEVGECDAASGFESAGGHLSGAGGGHGYLNPDGPHDGDLPNQWIGEDGKLDVTLFSPRLALVVGEENNPDDDRTVIAGSTTKTAIIVHEKADDYITDPSGESGARLACGVIELAPPFGG
jgi:Cu-Zn family superoxide dismutase